MGNINSFDIQNILNNNQLDAFVETGTLHGDAVEFIRQYNFKEIYSIEIIEDLANKASARFKDDDRVSILTGHSADVMSSLVNQLDCNTLFWLDAHFPGVDSRHNEMTDTIKKEYNAPLKKELESIAKRVENYNDVIIMDDLWVYEDGPFEAGLFNNHMKNMGWNVTRESLCGESIDFVWNLFDKTHNIRKFYHQQGFVVVTPKK